MNPGDRTFRREAYGLSLFAIGTYAVFGPWIFPNVALVAPLRIDLIVLALLGLSALRPGGAWQGGGSPALEIMGPRMPPLIIGGLLGAAFVAPWVAFPFLVAPALGIAWAERGRTQTTRRRQSALPLILLAGLTNTTLVATTSSRGLQVPPEEFAEIPFPVNSLLAEVPLHDVWAVDLKGHPSPTLEDLGSALRNSSPLQATPAAMGLSMLRGLMGSTLGWEDPEWFDERSSFVHRLPEAYRSRSETEPGTTLGIWRVLYLFPEEGVVETLNGTVHVAVAATIGEGPVGHRLFLSFRVREVNWTTRFYMKLIDPCRRFFVYPSLLRQFAHTWERGGWGEQDGVSTGGT